MEDLFQEKYFSEGVMRRTQLVYHNSVVTKEQPGLLLFRLNNVYRVWVGS
jgi:hypothetical protein